jgi:RNA polymerase sigma-70 factor (ECF subfamily)
VNTVEQAEPFIATRWSLLSRLRNLDDHASWQDFFNTYWKLIYGVALKAGLNDAAAQDVVQETVLTVIRKLPEFKTDPQAGSFKGWLLHIVRWRVADQHRRQQRHNRWLAPAAAADTHATPVVERIPDPAGFNLERVWDEEWEKNLVDIALDRVKTRVSATLYQMFDLYVVKQWPARDVAKALRVSVGHVYVAKHRVSAQVQKEIRELKQQRV